MSMLARNDVEIARLRKILYWAFVLLFCSAEILAFVTSGILLLTNLADTNGLIRLLFWMLWTILIVGVGTGLFALKKDFFELSSNETLSDLKNSLAEVIDGLEASGRLSEQEAAQLRRGYEDRIGVSGTVHPRSPDVERAWSYSASLQLEKELGYRLALDHSGRRLPLEREPKL